MISLPICGSHLELSSPKNVAINLLHHPFSFSISKKQTTTLLTHLTMVMSRLLSFIFPPPPSLVVSTMSVVSLVSLANAGLSEIRGKHLNYSKFWNANPSSEKQIKLSSKAGMLLLYTPAFLAGLASFWIFPHEGLRSTLLQSAVTLHFFKRVFEVSNTIM